MLLFLTARPALHASAEQRAAFDLPGRSLRRALCLGVPFLTYSLSIRPKSCSIVSQLPQFCGARIAWQRASAFLMCEPSPTYA